MDDLTERITQIAADLLAVPVSELGEDSGPGNPEGWDSLLSLNMLVAIEDELGLRFTPDDIEAMTSVRAIAEVVRSRSS